MSRNFKPSVAEVVNINSIHDWQGIMPHDIRSRAWTLICNIQDYVVEMSSQATQLFLQVNKGYRRLEGLAIMVTGIYLAMNDLDTLLKITTVKEHFDKMNEQIAFPQLIGPEDISPFLGKYLMKVTTSALVDALRFKFISVDNIKEKLNSVRLAKNRLQFFPPNPFTIFPGEKKKRLAACNTVILKFDQAIFNAGRINAVNEHLREDARKVLSAFKEAAANDQFSIGVLFYKALKNIKIYSDCSFLAIEGFYKCNDFDAWVNDILAITPPAPTK